MGLKERKTAMKLALAENLKIEDEMSPLSRHSSPQKSERLLNEVNINCKEWKSPSLGRSPSKESVPLPPSLHFHQSVLR